MIEQKKDTQRAIYEAAWLGRSSQFKVLSDSGVNVSHVYANGRTLLHTASWFNHDDIILELLKIDKNLMNVKDDSGLTAIDLAIQSGSFSSFKALVISGDDLLRVSKKGYTIAHKMVEFNRVNFMVWLDEYNKDLLPLWTKQDDFGDTPAHLAARKGATKVMNWLCHRGSKKTDCNFAGHSIAMVAKNKC